jgi:hypothetical protein
MPVLSLLRREEIEKRQEEMMPSAGLSHRHVFL